MFWKHNTVAVSDIDLQESIKRDLKKKLNAKGVIISGVNMELKPESISLCLNLSCVRPKRHHLMYRR